MPARPLWSPAAQRDLVEIWSRIALDSPEQADRALLLIEGKARVLCGFPLGGRERPELRHGIRSFPAGSHVIFYVPAKSGILVARVIHGSRDIRSGDLA